MKTRNAFYTLSGRLTPYALACGYIEQFDTKPGQHAGQRVTMWQDGGCSCIHVRAHDFDTGQRLFWDTLDTLKQARKRFDEAKRLMRAGTKGK